MHRLLDSLIAVGEILMPPWRRWSQARTALVGAVAVLAVVVSVVWQVGRWVMG